MLYQRVRRDEHLRKQTRDTPTHHTRKPSRRARTCQMDKEKPTNRGRQNQIRTSIWPPDVGDLAPVAASGLAALAAVGGNLSAWTGCGAGATRAAELRSARDGRKKREPEGRRWRAHARRWRGADATAAAAGAGKGIARAGRAGVRDGERKREQ